MGKSIENIKQYLFIIRVINKQIFAVKKSHEIVNKHEKIYRSVQDKTYLTKYQILLQKYKWLCTRLTKEKEWKMDVYLPILTGAENLM